MLDLSVLKTLWKLKEQKRQSILDLINRRDERVKSLFKSCSYHSTIFKHHLRFFFTDSQVFNAHHGFLHYPHTLRSWRVSNLHQGINHTQTEG